MFAKRRVAVIVPAYCEEDLIQTTLRGLPSWIDVVVVVDDASRDSTAERARELADPRVRVVCHPLNRGVGAAIATGYRRALAEGAQVMVVMAGDNQMDPSDLPRLLGPAVEGRADYVKGNRLRHTLRRDMPWLRQAAGHMLAWCTNFAAQASGVHLAIGDSQCGYTALTSDAAERIPLDELWPGYGYPNDLLLLIAGAGLRVREVPVRPVYADERSGVHVGHMALILGILARRTVLARRRPGSGAHLTEPTAARK